MPPAMKVGADDDMNIDQLLDSTQCINLFQPTEICETDGEMPAHAAASDSENPGSVANSTSQFNASSGSATPVLFNRYSPAGYIGRYRRKTMSCGRRRITGKTRPPPHHKEVQQRVIQQAKSGESLVINNPSKQLQKANLNRGRYRLLKLFEEANECLFEGLKNSRAQRQASNKLWISTPKQKRDEFILKCLDDKTISIKDRQAIAYVGRNIMGEDHVLVDSKVHGGRKTASMYR